MNTLYLFHLYSIHIRQQWSFLKNYVCLAWDKYKIVIQWKPVNIRELKQIMTMTATRTPSNKRFNEQNNGCARALEIFVYFVAVLCKTTTWNDQVLRSLGNANAPMRSPIPIEPVHSFPHGHHRQRYMARGRVRTHNDDDDDDDVAQQFYERWRLFCYFSVNPRTPASRWHRLHGGGGAQVGEVARLSI